MPELLASSSSGKLPMTGTPMRALSTRDGGDATPPQDRANRPNGKQEVNQFLPVERLREQFINYLTSKEPEIEEQKEAKRYYHAAQWSAEHLRILRDRKQAPITFNRLARKINGICGLVERSRSDPKGFPTKPRNEEGAELATQVVREILDASDWKTAEAECIRHCSIDGISGIEILLVDGDHDDPDIAARQVFGDDYFYDPRSYRYDFDDARYEGIAKWMDIEEAIELLPDKEDILRGLILAGSDLTTRSDREFKWVLSTEQQLRLVEHWYRHRGQWCWAIYVSNVLLDEGVSPFRDAKGKTARRFVMFSAAVDHDGDRYGFPRNLKGAQDEINQRRTKGVHLSNSRRLILEKGAVDNVERTRTEWARADGVVEVNPGKLPAIKIDDTSPELLAQAQWYGDAKDEIEQFANTNIANLNQGALSNLSGRAVSLLQQPGLAELGPFLLSVRGWKLRVYRALWHAAQTHWTAERWIRVTDDGKIKDFLQINGLDLDETLQPVLVNALGTLDVDIILDEGPDVQSLMQDTFEVLRNQPPGTFPPAVMIELSPIQGSVKEKILKMMQPAPADPLDAAAKKLTIETLAAQIEELRAVVREKDSNVIKNRASAVQSVFTAAMNAGKAGIPGAPVAALGVESAPIEPAPGHAAGLRGFVDQPPQMPQQEPDVLPGVFRPQQGFVSPDMQPAPQAPGGPGF